MSPELHQFLTEWLADATSSNPSSLCRGYGLCSQIPPPERRRLRNLFSSQNLNVDFPFNGSPSAYFAECERKQCHLNPRRLAFVRSLLDGSE